VKCTAGYFNGGSTVTWTFNSTPVALGTTTAAADGTATINFSVPNVETGSHTITATGTGAGGQTVTASLTLTAGFDVIAAGINTPTTVATTTGLPVTGSGDTGILVTAGAALVVAGSLTVLVTRRRRTAHA
jgi:LPXTG-motif cell wall-anchored protein